MPLSAKRMELAFWAMLPSMITLALLVLYLVPKHVSGLGSFMPLLPLIPVFYWGMAHTQEIPYWFVFLLGLCIDAVTGMPLGISSLLYVLFLSMLRAQRKYIHKEGFIIKWGYFAALLFLILTLNWLVISLLQGQLRAVDAALAQWVLTLGCYPLLHKLFDGLARYISDRRWRIAHTR